MKSDSQLQQDVLAELRREPAVNAAHVGVEVTHGVVILTGRVGTCSQQWDATPGVRSGVDRRTVAV